MPGSDLADALVVIVHYGDARDTVRLSNQMVGLARRVVVVANDRSEAPEGLSAQVVWERPARNLGFSGGAMHALPLFPETAWVAILNNDLVLPDSSFHGLLADLEQRDDLGAVGPILRYTTAAVQSGCGGFKGLLRTPDFENDPGPRLAECTWITGAALFLRRRALDEAGWDTSYFLGFEELDLCARLHSRGYVVACDGRLPATHDSGQSIGIWWTYYYVRNRLWFARKNESRWRTALVVLVSVRSALESTVGDARRRRGFARSRLTWRGVIDGLAPGAKDRREPLPDEPRAASSMSGRRNR